MKIEKINENQIRCVLTKQDLMDRQIKLSELAYGSDKAKSLFRDMIAKANEELGFEIEDIPFMVEAIPTSQESVILVISKVEYPEELDTRFSRFSEPDEDMLYDESDAGDAASVKGADDVLGMFEKKIKETKADEEISKEQNEESKETVSVLEDLTKMFEFSNFAQIERLARVLADFYHGKNDLYKNEAKKKYYLMIHKGDHTPKDFNKVCNIASEYASQKHYLKSLDAFYTEHGWVMIKDNALQTIASL